MIAEIMFQLDNLFFTIYWIAYVFVITIKGGIISEMIQALINNIFR